MSGLIERARVWLLSRPLRVSALVAGAFAALVHQPFGFLPGLLAYPALLWMLDRLTDPGRASLIRAFQIGWLSGFVYFLISCWWVAEAFMVDAESHAWMAPFAATLLPALLGVFWGLAFALYRLWILTWTAGQADRRGPAWRFVVFSLAFIGFEWLRGWAFGGFPWNPAGASWQAGSAMSQAAAYVGVVGLGLITLLGMTGIAVVRPGSDWRGFKPAFPGLLLLLLVFVGGAFRLHAAGPVVHPNADKALLTVRLIQPNIGQAAKWSPDHFAKVVETYLRLSTLPAQAPAHRRPDVIVWSEGAIPASANELFAPDSWTAPLIAGVMQPGQTLMMGAYRSHREAGQPLRWYNSLLVLQPLEGRTGAAQVVGLYDKFRLVPFGEYLPLDELLTPLGVKELARIGDGYTAGLRPIPLRVPSVPIVQPLICYEGLYSGLARPPEGVRARWILNISNDAWFGPTSGPRQHFNLSAFRAIEEGLPMVRSTPTGISVVVDAYGRSLPGSTIALRKQGVIDVNVPRRGELTLFTILRDGFSGVFTLFFLAILAFFGLNRVKVRDILRHGVK
ncbi:MAG: apolipoprotein N-acyltransferase [Asticcacaulis sp.]